MMLAEGLFFVLLWMTTNTANIDILECDPPDMPIWGGYGPVEEVYSPGDVIHYYCAVDTFIGGNYRRVCEDTGAWSGDTPVCDAPSGFISTSQSSTADETSGSGEASDGMMDTCSKTLGRTENGNEWSGTFVAPGQLIRVMLFLPQGQVSFQVILVKQNGEEIVCGEQSRNIDRHEWSIQNCPEPHNTGARGLKIRSLTNEPLQICEIRASVLTSPKCTDPHVHVENGHLRINRKSAVLVCDRGFQRSPDTKLECVREGVWNRKTLYCSESNWNGGGKESNFLDNNPQRGESERERETLSSRRRKIKD